MKKKIIVNDNIGSVVPLAVAILIIIIAGILFGILSIFLAPISDKSNTINSLMSNIWLFIPVVVLIVTVFWLMTQAQRKGGYGF